MEDAPVGRRGVVVHRDHMAPAAHFRFFCGLRLHLLCTLGGLPVAFTLAGAKADERLTPLGMLATEPDLLKHRRGQDLIADMQYYGRDFEHALAAEGAHLLRKARKGEPHAPARICSGRYVKPSSRSTRPSRAGSTSNATADACSPASPSA